MFQSLKIREYRATVVVLIRHAAVPYSFQSLKIREYRATDLNPDRSIALRKFQSLKIREYRATQMFKLEERSVNAKVSVP